MRKFLLVSALFTVVLLLTVPVKAQTKEEVEQLFNYGGYFSNGILGRSIFPNNPVGESIWGRSMSELSRYNTITYENMDNLTTGIRNFSADGPSKPLVAYICGDL